MITCFNVFVEIFKKKISIPLFKNAYNLIIGTGITSIFGFIFWFLATKIYSAEAIGVGSALISAIGMLAIFGELGLGIAIIRFLSDNAEKSRILINTCITICTGFSLILSIIFLLGLKIWSPNLTFVLSDPIYFGLFIIFTLICTIQPLILNIFLTRKETRYIIFINTISSLLKIFFIVLLSFLLNNTFGIYLAYGFSMIISLIVAIYVWIPRVQKQYYPSLTLDFNIIHEIGAYALNNYIARVFLQVTPLVIPIILITILGPVDTAYFFIGWSIASLLQIIPSSIFNSLLAESRSSTSNISNNVRKSLQLMLLILIPALITILILGKTILLFFGRIYSENSYSILCIMAFSVLPWGINYLYISIERMKKDTKKIIYISVGSFILSLGLGSILVFKIGLLGMGVGYLIGQTIIAIILSIDLWYNYYANPNNIN